jgi:hypothetical protein
MLHLFNGMCSLCGSWDSSVGIVISEGMDLTTHSKARTARAILYCIPLWHKQGQIYCLIFVVCLMMLSLTSDYITPNYSNKMKETRNGKAADRCNHCKGKRKQ